MSCGEREVIESRVSEITVVCPSCGKEGAAQAWERVEAALSPEAAAKVATGEIFIHTCPSCGAMVPMDHPLFFIDRDRCRAAYYPAGQDDLASLKVAFTQMIAKFRGVELSRLGKSEFEMRVTPRRYELPEKVAIWSVGLNDKVMELLKAEVLDQLAAGCPGRGIVDAQFGGVVELDGGEKAVELILFDEKNTPGLGIKVPFAAYRALATDIEVRTQVDKNRTPVVDLAWGRKVLAAVRAASGR